MSQVLLNFEEFCCIYLISLNSRFLEMLDPRTNRQTKPLIELYFGTKNIYENLCQNNLFVQKGQYTLFLLKHVRTSGYCRGLDCRKCVLGELQSTNH